MSNDEKAISITMKIKEIEKKKKLINKWIIREYVKHTMNPKNQSHAIDMINNRVNTHFIAKELFFENNGEGQLAKHEEFLDEILSYIKKASKTIISFLFIIVLSLVVFTWIANERYKTLSKERYEKEEQDLNYNRNGDVHSAWAYMQQFVEQRLKSPRSADFRFGGYRDVTNLGNGRYKVNSYVDAENSFGANIRTHFNGVIRRKDGAWVLEYLTFGDIQSQTKKELPQKNTTDSDMMQNCKTGCSILCIQENSCSDKQWIQNCVYSCTH